MPTVTIDIPSPGLLIDAITFCARRVEAGHELEGNSRPSELQQAAIVRDFVDLLTVEVTDAREREAFDDAWNTFVGHYIFDDDTEKNQQRNGFIEGWIRARYAEGSSSVFMTSEARKQAAEIARREAGPETLNGSN